MLEVKLPELGENIDEVDVAAVLVKVGDTIRRDQPVIEVETEKASLEVPATCDGEVQELLVSAGDKIRVDQVILRVAPQGGAATQLQADRPPAAAAPKKEKAAAPAAALAPAPAPAPAARTAGGLIAFPAAQRPAAIGSAVPAAPSVRALARELGLEIAEVPGSGPRGRISRDDVKAFAKQRIRGAAVAGPAAVAPALPDFSQWGDVEREPLTKVRQATAAAMARSWSTIPQVTQFDHADITTPESMRKSFNQRPESQEHKLTMTALVVKTVATALRRFPQFNASLDLAGNAVILKKYVHIGVAVDTERGLLVPVIRDVDRKGVLEVARELNELARKARAKALTPDAMRGATFTVSNLGGLGTTYFSPIVNWPEVAILGVGRGEQQAVFVDGGFQPRLILPLSVSYDHRLIDGADAARFLRWLAEALEQPLLLLLDA